MPFEIREAPDRQVLQQINAFRITIITGTVNPKICDISGYHSGV
jgi:hypothetical protein